MPVFLIAVLILLLLFVLATLPSYRNHPDLKIIDGKYIAHRGLHSEKDNIPENSMPAFERAIAFGYMTENDIHITADGEIVIFHDSKMNRMCGVDKVIEDLTLEEIRRYYLKNSNEKIPTLKEFLRLADGRVPLLIEFKCELHNYKRLCEEANKILSEYKGKYIIESFNPFVLYWYKKHHKDIMRGQLALHCKDKGFVKGSVSCFLMNFLTKPDFVAFDCDEPYRPMFTLQRLYGAFPVGWTFRSQEDVEKKKKIFKTYIFENFIPKN